MMYRVVAIAAGSLALAACSSSSDFFSTDALKPSPMVDSVTVESAPAGAEAKASTGQTCRTPCALVIPTNGPVTVTVSLAGYQAEQETLELVTETGRPPVFRPNPVTVELTPAPASARPAAKKPAPKPAARKPATSQAKPAPAPAAAAAPPPPAGNSPWPSQPAR